jgi:hypothetical protein
MAGSRIALGIFMPEAFRVMPVNTTDAIGCDDLSAVAVRIRRGPHFLPAARLCWTVSRSSWALLENSLAEIGGWMRARMARTYSRAPQRHM